MKKKIASLFLILAAIMCVSCAGCSKKSKEPEKKSYNYSNDTEDEEIKGLFETMLGDNESAESIIYKLRFPLKVNNTGVRFEVLDSDAIDTNGNLTGKNKENETVTIQVKYKGEYYYFKVIIPSGDKKDKAYLKMASEKLLYNTDNIKGNITLVDTLKEFDGLTVTWKSSNTSVITDTATGNNGEIPAGLVTRGESDTNVKLTATLKLGEQSLEKEFNVIVKAKPAEKVYDAYLYSYFRGNIYGNGESQKIHMATSKDGFFWETLNNNEAILTNTEGTKGVRDSFLLRTPDGDHFYLIGTDLDANGGDWASYAGKGSKKIVIWESDDLVNWSDVRLIEIAPENAGCMWAPEAFFDDTTGEFVVYFSTGVSGSGKKIWYVKTRDFYNFTEAKIYKDEEPGKTFIDTSMIYYNGTYFRFTKNENNITILLETSDKVLGDFTLVKEEIAGEKGVEGPSIYKINGEEKWVLYMDGYADSNWGVGYFPLIADSFEDLKNGNFRRLSAEEYKLPKGAKHGSFIPITKEEYDALQKAYNNK